MTLAQHHASTRPCPVDAPATLTPERAFAAWPAEAPLAALWSAPGEPASRARWTLLTSPGRVSIHTGQAAALALDLHLGRPIVAGTVRSDGDGEALPPFTTGHLVALAYELGGTLEPAARAPGPGPGRRPTGGAWPDLALLRYDGAYAHDRLTGRWWAIGDTSSLPAIASLDRAERDGEVVLGPLAPRDGAGPDPARAYRAAVEAGIELIRAGDVFQVNLSHHLGAAFRGDPRRLFLRMARASAPWHGAYMELPGEGQDEGETGGRYLLSCSPELFVTTEPGTGRLVTRPMKGTRRIGADPASARASLEADPKDGAELAMIVDLSRNDLGRVCSLGSVRVEEARAIEAHARASGPEGVWQAVATVSGVPAPGRTVADLLRAAFPPGSITGAPKIRAMQIIETLEPVRRGAYCGAIGYVGDDGGVALNVAIRTAMLEGRGIGDGGRVEGALVYPVGAGIVADSDPEAEWRETLAKAAWLARCAEESER